MNASAHVRKYIVLLWLSAQGKRKKKSHRDRYELIKWLFHHCLRSYSVNRVNYFFFRSFWIGPYAFQNFFDYIYLVNNNVLSANLSKHLICVIESNYKDVRTLANSLYQTHFNYVQNRTNTIVESIMWTKDLQ